jgi:hypothetical protein
MSFGHPLCKQTICTGNYWDWEGDEYSAWCPLEHAAYCDL